MVHTVRNVHYGYAMGGGRQEDVVYAAERNTVANSAAKIKMSASFEFVRVTGLGHIIGSCGKRK